MAFDLLLNVDFVDGQAVVDGVWVAGFRVEQVGLQVERIGQAVSRVHAHYQGPIAQAGKLQAGRGGQTGFADASFAAEEKDAHNFMVPR